MRWWRRWVGLGGGGVWRVQRTRTPIASRHAPVNMSQTVKEVLPEIGSTEAFIG